MYDGGISHYLTSYLQFGNRQTGRTTNLIESVRSGDTIVTSPGSRRHMENVLRDHGWDLRKTKVHVIGAKDLNDLYEQLRGYRGRILYDHTFLEQVYTAAIENTKSHLENIEHIHAERG